MKWTILLVATTAIAVLIVHRTELTHAQQEIIWLDDPILTYNPGEWRNPNEPAACLGSNWHESGLYNQISLSYTYPQYGYPMRTKLFVGLNDTVQVEIFWQNRTNKAYSLVGKSPEKWFRPRVFLMDDVMSKGIPWRDSTDLGYRIRGWRRGQKYKMQPQTVIPAWFNGTWSMVMDVWDLPEGHYSLCIDTTNYIPKDFLGQTGGDNYEYYQAHDLADTINAYEGCFWRMIYDSNYVAAKIWIDQMIVADSASIPAWMLRGLYYEYVPDTVEIKRSYDKALHFMDTNGDPAMPDSTKRLLMPAEKHYVEWCRQQSTYERGRYAP